MPIVWQEARDYVASGHLELLKRSPEGTEKYRQHKQTLSGDISIDVCGKLEWDPQEIIELNTVRFPDVTQKVENAFGSSKWFKTTVNDFPYDFEPGIHHLLIWSKISLPMYTENSETIQNEIYEKISSFLKYNLELLCHLDNQDYLFFINYSNLQSVKAISHVHLLLHTDESVANKILSNQLEPYTKH